MKYFNIIILFCFINYNWFQPIVIDKCKIEINSEQTPSQLLNELVLKFQKVQDYKADVNMVFDIPFVRIGDLKGIVYFQQPDKFRIKTEGIAFLPKQNPYYALAVIKDSMQYSAVESGKENMDGINTRVINVLPHNH